MRFSDEKTKAINKQACISVGEKRLFIYRDSISIGRREDDGTTICNIEDLKALEDACRVLRETISAVADIWW